MANRHSPEVKARALAILKSNQGNWRKTESETGFSRSTLKSWAAMAERTPGFPSLVMEKDEILASKLLEASNMAVDRVFEALPKASAKDAAIVAGITIDKRQLLLGRATART